MSVAGRIPGQQFSGGDAAMSTEQRLVNEEVRALIGARGPVRSARDEVSTSEIRRFAQAIFDDTRLFYDDEAASKSRFGSRVAPGTFAMHVFRPNIPFADDALRWANATDEMHRVAVTEGLPLPDKWDGLYHFHAGDDMEFLRLPHVGDRLTGYTYLKDIYEKSGRNGALAFYVVRTDWKNQRDEIVASHDMNLVWMEQSREGRRESAKSFERRDPPKMPAPKPLDLPRANFEELTEGQSLPTKMIRVTVPTVVRWAMATEAFRRDHYDYEFATQVAGVPHIIASAMWTLGCRWSYLNQLAGCDGWVWKMSHSVRARMNIGDSLTFSSTVAKLERRDKYGLVEAEVNLTNQDGTVVAPGRTSIALPYRGGPAVAYPFVP
jgi:acyl dehydratase